MQEGSRRISSEESFGVVAFRSIQTRGAFQLSPRTARMMNERALKRVSLFSHRNAFFVRAESFHISVLLLRRFIFSCLAIIKNEPSCRFQESRNGASFALALFLFVLLMLVLSALLLFQFWGWSAKRGDGRLSCFE